MLGLAIMTLRISLALAALFLASACTDSVQGTGGGDDTSSGNGGAARVAITNVEHLCELLVEQCQLVSVSMAECVSTYELVRVSEACLERAEAATCDDIADVRSYCFPPCAGGKGSCNDDGSLTTCANGATVTLDCEAGCAAQGMSYSGSCGLESPITGESSTTNDCWCQ